MAKDKPKQIIIEKIKEPDGPPPEEGLPTWMATFADMVTLLLCFFILLLSFAKQDLQKFKELLGSLKNGFGIAVERLPSEYLAIAPSRVEREGYVVSKQSKQLLGLILRIKDILNEDDDLRKSTGVNADRDGVTLRVDSAAMFMPGSANMRPEAKRILKRVVDVLKEYNLDLVVRGHTDDQEQGSQAYPSRWELSSARAAAALEYILDQGIPSTRMKAVGYADTRPLVDNTSPANRAKNRRLEFYFHQPETDSW